MDCLLPSSEEWVDVNEPAGLCRGREEEERWVEIAFYAQYLEIVGIKLSNAVVQSTVPEVRISWEQTNSSVQAVIQYLRVHPE